MKKVVKVSIGNIAFTIEEDGYLVLKGYLEELNDHYRAKQNGNEIIEGIEERMSELFIEKAGKDAMVTLPVVKEVIGILGRPDD
ncbi:MAG: PspC family transcriptional regulator, partial [Bacteroidales bacterium]|nr:PspC family transcriptional regulator [Bacteroidales bacterium]